MERALVTRRQREVMKTRTFYALGIISLSLFLQDNFLSSHPSLDVELEAWKA